MHMDFSKNKCDKRYSTDLVCFLYFFLIYSYLALGSCKQWEENMNKLDLISQIEQLKISRNLFFLHYFWGNYIFPEWTVKHFSSLYCFCFCFLHYFAKVDRFGFWTAENFSSLFCFSSLYYILFRAG